MRFNYIYCKAYLYIMKVLWFSNLVIGNKKSLGSGSWLFAMKNIICNNVDLYNITDSNIRSVQHSSNDSINEYVLPVFKLKDGLPSKKNIAKIVDIVNEINPDVIHIWGVEKYWGLLYTRGYLKGNSILEIQGLWSSCVNVYFGGLQISTLLRQISIKEILKPASYLPFRMKADLVKKSVLESEMISYFEHISTQSDWTREQLRLKVDVKTKIYSTKIPIRDYFCTCGKWRRPTGNVRPIIFTSLSYNTPFKGLHILLQSLPLLKVKYPNILLKIAGFDVSNTPFYRRNSYDNYLLYLIDKNNLTNNVEFLGQLETEQIATELLNCNVYVNSSFVESYSVAAAEALFLGVPSVLSYAGAMPEFSKYKAVALYYSPLDYVSCAGKINEILNNIELQNKLTENSSLEMFEISNSNQICETQLLIYKKLVDR